jgi:hypothetical protein
MTILLGIQLEKLISNLSVVRETASTVDDLMVKNQDYVDAVASVFGTNAFTIRFST